MDAKSFLEQLVHDDIVAAIREAEAQTSGEIRVFISHRNVGDVVAAAHEQFSRLGMSGTRERNGILIYVAPLDRKFAVVGDAGIHARCGEEAWKTIAAGTEADFRQGRFTHGIALAVRQAGELLRQHFPRQPDDRNELPDDVVAG